MSTSKSGFSIVGVDDSACKRMVVLRFFLDRPGYDLHNCAARLWKDPPEKVRASDVHAFLVHQGIAQEGLVVEIYLDRYQAYMAIEICEEESIVFDFSSTTVSHPGKLIIRLTDTTAGADAASTVPQQQSHSNSSSGVCNTSPAGLFAFALTVALESAHLLGELVPNSVDPSFVLTWGPYAFFVSGFLQLIVGMMEATRNNIYGATAFMVFGCIWLSNGTKLIFTSYFPADIPQELTEGTDPAGHFILSFYVCAFVCVLFKQTLTMNKCTSILIGLLIVSTFASCWTGWSIAFVWIKMIVTWFVSFWAFFLFSVELTNEVYQEEIYHFHPWHNKYSSGEAFGAAGRGKNLQSKATQLRTAHYSNKANKAKNFQSIRTVAPEKKLVDENGEKQGV